MTVSAKKSWNSLKIYINDILHLSIATEEHLGLQAWKDNNKWCIEIYLRNTDVLVEYDDFDKWKEVLKLLDENL